MLLVQKLSRTRMALKRCITSLFVHRCAIEDNTYWYAAIQMSGYVNLTVNNSDITGRNYGIIVSSAWIGSRVSVKNTVIRGRRYGVQCYGSSTVLDCHVENSQLQSITCQHVRSCTVQRCIMNSSTSSYQAINAYYVQTLVIDRNIIANNTPGEIVRVSYCNDVQASFVHFYCRKTDSNIVTFLTRISFFLYQPDNS